MINNIYREISAELYLEYLIYYNFVDEYQLSKQELESIVSMIYRSNAVFYDLENIIKNNVKKPHLKGNKKYRLRQILIAAQEEGRKLGNAKYEKHYRKLLEVLEQTGCEQYEDYLYEEFERVFGKTYQEDNLYVAPLEVIEGVIDEYHYMKYVLYHDLVYNELSKEDYISYALYPFTTHILASFHEDFQELWRVPNSPNDLNVLLKTREFLMNPNLPFVKFTDRYRTSTTIDKNDPDTKEELELLLVYDTEEHIQKLVQTLEQPKDKHQKVFN